MIPRIQYKYDNRKWKRVQKELEILNNGFTAIGLHEGEEIAEKGSLTIAFIGVVNEFGTDKAGKNHNIRIPERAWMRNWFDTHKKQIEKKMQLLYDQVLNGYIDAKKAIALLGQWYQSELRKSITEFSTPPNAPSTIQKKGSSHPLIDSGQMRATVIHKEYYGQDMNTVGQD